MTAKTPAGGDAFTAEELQSLGEVDPSPSGEPAQRFLQRCLDWNQEWIAANAHALQTNAVSASQILLFVYCEAPEIEHKQFAALGIQAGRIFSKSLALDSQGVVLCNENFVQMRCIRVAITSLDEALGLVVEHLKDEQTFAIASLAQRRLLVHSAGEALNPWCEEPTAIDLRFSPEQLSAARIENDVQNFHAVYLQHAKSSVAQMVWKGKKYPYQLIVQPERRIQSYLLLHLRGSYEHLKGIVDEESVGKGGRCDIQVKWPSPQGVVHPYTTTMLELKVLAEGQGPTYHYNWVLSGIQQADDYRLPNTEAVYACVFDARKDQSNQMLPLDDVAVAKNVRLRRYLMQAPVPVEGEDEHEDDSAAAPPNSGKAPKKPKNVKAAKVARGKPRRATAKA